MFIPGKFNDTLIRNEVISFFKQRFRIKLKHNDLHNKIDLVGVNDTTLGVEVEHGKWVGDFWENDHYSLISEQKFRTANIPMRKEKYWLDEFVYYNKVRKNLSGSKNIFVRSNIDFTQFLVIRPETIRDPKKLIRTKFKPSNSNDIEEWLSFKMEDVETYNVKNGKFYKQKVNGTRKSVH